MKIEIKQIAIVVALADDTVRQVALTKDQSELVLQMIDSVVPGNIKVLPKKLNLTLEPYKK